ncbi:hypothetical protein [Terriglobus saanensis]|uniref:Right handed beta helix domain-containing protein n=1 Tax=Terriglobus saanensis (strain ATCC BAA-1853 / DSM 23119 / SP1PR4) TaxID=401053 RepID=E8V6R4_TERSS|nr:hypothetical protein [Terriglobus saanensis]ADV83866.1 hypothetical protein AciPR4_3108 [Terriglobus saanensis SP1PR4]
MTLTTSLRFLIAGCLFGPVISPVSGQQRTQSATQYRAEQFAGVDLGAKIVAADAAMKAAGVAEGTISVNASGSVPSPISLSQGHSLRLNAPVTLNAVITLTGNNKVSCASGVLITVHAGFGFKSTGDNPSLQDCKFAGDGSADATALSTSNSSHIKMSNVQGKNIGIVHTMGGADLQVSHVSVTGAVYGVVFQGTNNVTAEDVACDGTANCVQWFNRDSNFNAGGPNSRAMVQSMGAGHYRLNNIRCHNVTACAWGSVGYDAVVSNSVAVNCADVCFDAEGSMDINFLNDTASGGKNGDGSVFFFSNNVSFTNPHFTAAGFLIKVYNSSLNPNLSSGLHVTGGLLDCGKSICTGFGGDAWTDLTIEGVEFRNATITAATQGGGSHLRNNHLLFNVEAGAPFSAVGLPTRIFGSLTEIESNRIEGVTQPAKSSGITVESSYFNATQTFQIRNNTITGFPIDIYTANDGANVGVGTDVVLDGNRTGSNTVIHVHPGANHDTYSETSRFTLSGGKWIKADLSQPGPAKASPR